MVQGPIKTVPESCRFPRRGPTSSRASSLGDEIKFPSFPRSKTTSGGCGGRRKRRKSSVKTGRDLNNSVADASNNFLLGVPFRIPSPLAAPRGRPVEGLRGRGIRIRNPRLARGTIFSRTHVLSMENERKYQIRFSPGLAVGAFTPLEMIFSLCL